MTRNREEKRGKLNIIPKFTQHLYSAKIYTTLSH